MTSYTNRQLTQEETEKRSHSSGLGGLGNWGHSVLPPEHCRSGRPRRVLRGAAQGCVHVCGCADSQSRSRLGPGSEGGTLECLGDRGCARTGRARLRGALRQALRPSGRPSTAPVRGHSVCFVRGSEAVWEDSLIDRSSFVYTCETYHY